MTDERYNGWTNRTTWAVQLHLTNTEGTYSEMRDRAAEIVADADSRSDAISGMADFIEGWCDDLVTMTLGDQWRTGTNRMRMMVRTVGNFTQATCSEIATHWVDEAITEADVEEIGWQMTGTAADDTGTETLATALAGATGTL